MSSNDGRIHDCYLVRERIVKHIKSLYPIIKTTEANVVYFQSEKSPD